MIRFEVLTPPTADLTSVAISPDGLYLAFAGLSEGQQKLWLRPLDQIAARPLAGTEGARNPFWSPDSRSIGFFAEGKLKRIDVAGGLPQLVANALHGSGGTWNREGVIVFSPAMGTPLFRVPASGGESVAVTRVDPPLQTQHSFPHFLPDGRQILFSSWGAESGIYLGSLDSAAIEEIGCGGGSSLRAAWLFTLHPAGHSLCATFQFIQRRSVRRSGPASRTPLHPSLLSGWVSFRYQRQAYSPTGGAEGPACGNWPGSTGPAMRSVNWGCPIAIILYIRRFRPMAKAWLWDALFTAIETYG